MPDPRGVGLEAGTPGLAGTQIGTTSDGRPIVAWPAGAEVPDTLDPIDGDPADSDWSGDTDAASGGGAPAPGYGADSWTSSGPGSLTNGDTSLAQLGDQVCSWVQSDDGSTVGFWFGVTDASNCYYVYLTPDMGRTAGLVDGFEDQDLSEYSKDTGACTIQSTTVKEGTYALQMDDSSAPAIWSVDGLPRYPKAGDTFQAWWNVEDGSNAVVLHWGIQHDDADWPPRYFLQYTGSDLYLKKKANGTDTTLASTAWTASASTWYRSEVQWAEDGTMTCTVYDDAGTQQVQISGTDTDYNSGGVGFQHNGATGTYLYWDSYEITSASLGAELRLGKYVDGVGHDLATDVWTPTDPTGWFLLKLGWYDTGYMKASAHLEHGGEALATATASDSTYTSGGVGVEFTEAGQNFDMFQRCGTPDRIGMVDGFEDVNFDEYGSGGSQGVCTIQTTHAKEGGYAVEMPAEDNNADPPTLWSTSGLPRHPRPGETFQMWWKLDASDSSAVIHWAVQDDSVKWPDRYFLQYHGNTPHLRLAVREGGTVTDLAINEGWSATAGNWYRSEVQWGADGTITGTVYDAAGTQQVQVTATDETWKSGGIGIQHNGAYGTTMDVGWFDGYEITDS